MMRPRIRNSLIALGVIAATVVGAVAWFIYEWMGIYARLS